MEHPAAPHTGLRTPPVATAGTHWPLPVWWAALVAWCQRAALSRGANEPCALLVEEAGAVALLPVTNSAAAPGHAFEIAPSALLPFVGEEHRLRAVVHVHAGTEAHPSAADVRGMDDSRLPYLICAWDGATLRARCFAAVAGVVTELALPA